MAKSRRRFLCMDCGIDTGKIAEFYMLQESIWLLVAKSDRGMLCISCLESRLGRKLTFWDFNNSYVNSLHFGVKSVRLLERLRTLIGGSSFWRKLWQIVTVNFVC